MRTYAVEIIFIGFLCSLSGGEDVDEHEFNSSLNSQEYYEAEGNDTELFDYPEGNEDIYESNLISSALKNDLPREDYFSGLKKWFHNYHLTGIKKPGLHKKKKFKKHSNLKYIGPLLLIALAKAANVLPVIKLILVALISLILFSKKALLVSLGSLFLILYDTFHKKKSQNNVEVNVVKDRGSKIPTPEHAIHKEDDKFVDLEEPWDPAEEEKMKELLSHENLLEHGDRRWTPKVRFGEMSRKITPMRRSYGLMTYPTYEM